MLPYPPVGAEAGDQAGEGAADEQQVDEGHRQVAAAGARTSRVHGSAEQVGRGSRTGRQQVFSAASGWQVDEREHGEEVERRAEQQQEQHPAGEQGDTIDGRGEGGRAVKAQRPVAEQNQREQRQAEQGRPFELPAGRRKKNRARGSGFGRGAS